MIAKSKAIDKLQVLKGDAKGLEASVFNACIQAIREMPEDDGWISVKEQMPPVEEEVFILADRGGHKVRTTAMYEDGTISTGDSCWCWYDLDFDYDEEKDEYLVPKGWWEYRHYNPDDVYNCAVDDEVTHWMPLPALPSEISGGRDERIGAASDSNITVKEK